ncbi:hypothetical protein O181_001762 [Austropuccinia psidii MF-1]|uniref:Uncharacterized protein n=1 Tax=Austropuccinia psidii MF-1 TaxID=1389203 RepID=A0A9Q3BBG6_9BASI|nr:hypothetical protein [Austropuccinia psidii MF-1]
MPSGNVKTSHKSPQFRLGDLILVFPLKFTIFNNLKKFKDSFSGPFTKNSQHETSAVCIKLTRELGNKNLTFLVSVVKDFTSSDEELSNLRKETPLKVPPLDQSEGKKALKSLKEGILRGKIKEGT